MFTSFGRIGEGRDWIASPWARKRLIFRVTLSREGALIA
jgi:hypothetical protein